MKTLSIKRKVSDGFSRSGSRQDFRLPGWPKLLTSSATAVIACLLATVTANAIDLANYESYNGFTCDSVPKLPAEETHPSLWFSAEEAAAMRA